MPVKEKFGWTTFGAVVVKQVSQTVNTAAGAITVVVTMKMSLSRAIRVLLQSVLYFKILTH